MLPIDNEVLLATNQEGLLKGYILIKKYLRLFLSLFSSISGKKLLKLTNLRRIPVFCFNNLVLCSMAWSSGCHQYAYYFFSNQTFGRAMYLECTD